MCALQGFDFGEFLKILISVFIKVLLANYGK